MFPVLKFISGILYFVWIAVANVSNSTEPDANLFIVIWSPLTLLISLGLLAWVTAASYENWL